MDLPPVYLGAAAVLLVTVSLGLIRVIRGPGRADRLLVVQLLGTTSVAFLLLVSRALGMPEVRDVALVFALFAAVVAIAFVEHGWD
ncbi:MAG: monovalent cation/H+ antiporter complex subunit F [Gemmatimonadota bacterium]|nr:monovalent cation/H+ antiporter complex subunit F [Gemmatimonadota bacterium]